MYMDMQERPLSPRECELLTLLAKKGMTVREAAKHMSIAEGTARTTLHNAKLSLGAKTTAHAVMLGLGYILGVMPPAGGEEDI